MLIPASRSLAERPHPYLGTALRLAYDLLGNGKTVFRGGYGLYGYRDQWNDYAGPSTLRNSCANTTLQGQLLWRTYPTLRHNCSGRRLRCSPPVELRQFEWFLGVRHAQPVSRNYNLTVSQQLPFSSLLEVAYVGSEGRNGPIEGNTNNLDARNLNVVQQGGLFAYRGWTTPLSPTVSITATSGATANACDTNANSGINNAAYPLNAIFGPSIVNVEQHLAIANYNALQTSWVRQKGRDSPITSTTPGRKCSGLREPPSSRVGA